MLNKETTTTNNNKRKIKSFNTQNKNRKKYEGRGTAIFRDSSKLLKNDGNGSYSRSKFPGSSSSKAANSAEVIMIESDEETEPSSDAITTTTKRSVPLTFQKQNPKAQASNKPIKRSRAQTSQSTKSIKQQKQNQQQHVISIHDSDSDDDSDDEYKTAPTSPVGNDSDDEYKTAPTSPAANDDDNNASDTVMEEGLNFLKRKIDEVEAKNQEDNRKKLKVIPEFEAKKSDVPSIGTKHKINNFATKNNLDKRMQLETKGEFPEQSVAAPITVPESISSSSKEEPSSSTSPSTTKATSCAATGDPSEVVLVYPLSGKNASVVCNSDILCLKPDKYLNDCVMDIYPKLLQDQIPRNDIHTFCSFFFSKLTGVEDSSSTSSRGTSVQRRPIRKSDTTIKYDSVRRWTKKIDIFNKKHLIVPIVRKYHWFLAVITNPGSCDGTNTDSSNEILIAEEDDEPISPSTNGDCYITFLDSLSFNHDDCYEQLCDYLKEEAVNRLDIKLDKFKKPKHVKGRAPQQDNKTDCGVYCLQCIKRIYEEPQRIESALLHPNVRNDYLWRPDDIPDFRNKFISELSERIEEYKTCMKERKKNQR